MFSNEPDAAACFLRLAALHSWGSLQAHVSVVPGLGHDERVPNTAPSFLEAPARELGLGRVGAWKDPAVGSPTSRTSPPGRRLER